MKKTQILAPFALALALVPVVSGCTAGQQVTAADIVQKMRETMKTTTSVQGTFDLALTINKDGLKALMGTIMPGMAGGTSGTSGKEGRDWTAQLPDSASVTLNYWKQAPDKARVEVVSASFPGAKGATLVYDGQKAYALDAVNNTVYTATPAKFVDKIPANVKAMLADIDLEKEIDKVISASDIKLTGTEKVAGLDAYKLEVTAKPDAATLLDITQAYKMQAGLLIKDLHITLWVDKDRSIPLKFIVEHPSLGSLTYTASKLDLNKPIDASMFVLQVPAGAKTVDLDQKADEMQPKQTTLPAARDAATNAGWRLLEPSYVPAGATLVGVTEMARQMGAGFTLSYSSASTDFSITQTNMQAKGDIQNLHIRGAGVLTGDMSTDKGVMKDVTVRGVQAKAITSDNGSWTSLMWQEKNSGLWVAIHGKLSIDEAVKIAEGLK